MTQPPCKTGKIGYGSAAEAQKILPVLKRRGRGKLNVYLCEHCRLWHLGRGNAPKPPKRVIAAPGMK